MVLHRCVNAAVNIFLIKKNHQEKLLFQIVSGFYRTEGAELGWGALAQIVFEIWRG